MRKWVAGAVLASAMLMIAPGGASGWPEGELRVADLKALEAAIAGYKGQALLVNFWASWCVPCRVEMPLLVDLAKSGTVAIYGVNYKDDADAARDLLRELGDPYTRIGADATGRVSIDWGVYGLPETFVIDASGRIAYKHVGPFDKRMLEEQILQVVARLQAEGAGS